MSDPFSDLQSGISERLHDSETVSGAYLAPIPIIIESLGDITTRIEKALSTGGIKSGNTGKTGMALLILTPKGRPADPVDTESQITSVRVSLFTRPLINSGATGQQKAPLKVLFNVIKQILTWNRGPGCETVKLTGWDSLETERELTYFADFEIHQILELQ